MSKKIVIGADGKPTASDATFADVFTTLFSTDTAVTGAMGLLQKGGLVLAGMAIQNKRVKDTYNFLPA